MSNIPLFMKFPNPGSKKKDLVENIRDGKGVGGRYYYTVKLPGPSISIPYLFNMSRNYIANDTHYQSFQFINFPDVFMYFFFSPKSSLQVSKETGKIRKTIVSENWQRDHSLSPLCPGFRLVSSVELMRETEGGPVLKDRGSVINAVRPVPVPSF